MNTEKGYLILDSLAAFSIILFICVILLPLFTNMEADRLDVKREIKAYHILYENLERYSHAVYIEGSRHVAELACTYETTIEHYSSDTEYVEGCVSYQNSEKQELRVCEIVKK